MNKWITTVILLVSTACNSSQTSVDEACVSYEARVSYRVPVELSPVSILPDCILYYVDDAGWFVCRTEDNRYIKVYTDKEYKTSFGNMGAEERLLVLNQAHVNFSMLGSKGQWFDVATGDFIMIDPDAPEGITFRNYTARGKVISWEDMANGEQRTEEIEQWISKTLKR